MEEFDSELSKALPALCAARPALEKAMATYDGDSEAVRIHSVYI